MSSDREDGKETNSLVNNSTDTLQAGTIGTLDFYVWTLISAIGIIFCLIHTEQEHFWSWTGATAAESQSLKSKIVVSVMSAVIGGCTIAILIKTISAVSFTLMKYQGANFSHFVSVIGGYSPSCLPLLYAGGRWFGIILVFVILIISTVTRQLAVVSMGVRLVSSNATMSAYTRDYKSCKAIGFISSIGRNLPSSTLDAFDSLRNQNATYTNEYYDRSIPEGLRGVATFQRELPFANVSCKKVADDVTFSSVAPMRPYLQNNSASSYGYSSWTAAITVVLNREQEGGTSPQWVLCTIDIGHATALTTCKDTLCHTERVSTITPFKSVNADSALIFMTTMFKMVVPGSSVARSPLASWMLGADITGDIGIDEKIPGESLEKVQERVGIFGTVVGRIMCDYNNGEPYEDTVTFQSNYIASEYYVYGILWKWPFWLLAGFIFVVWIVCMIALRITPESRLISIEWLLSQYITRNRYGYLSGGSLVEAHQKSLLQVVDENFNDKVGNVAIVQSGTCQDIRNKRVLHNRKYQ
ncbi:uncharacterized protein EV154DRAFT_495091 [Mucor mucedo]|uniref:uncharacterized protein n=1 Tax=Mucor mucedo TaxID=29922 RepID=UPI0022204F65|nr:uncharacterized protein EV154DRAFT_495091 [Mucor mucedo]KAI7895487.1 hypothetical protein EV154DRAFT_495091 [Mucor mucedo]